MTYCYDYPRPALTADVVALAPQRGKLRVLLVQRAHAPFRGTWALPGGFVDIEERIEDAARRELTEETGLTVRRIVQLGVYDAPARDPRGRTVSVAYLTLLPGGPVPPVAADDAERAAWYSLARPPRLAFDHAQVLADARHMLRGFATEPRGLRGTLLPPRCANVAVVDLIRAAPGVSTDRPTLLRRLRRSQG